MRNIFILLCCLSIVSCQKQEVEKIVPQINIVIDELLVSIPAEVPNEWEGVTSSIESGDRVLHIYDRFKKEIVQFNLDREVRIRGISFHSDSLNIGNSPFGISKLNYGYFLSSLVYGFLITDEQGRIIKIWDNYIPRGGLLKNWDYNSKFRLRSYKTQTLSMFDDWTIPIHVELANIGFVAVYEEDFTEYDIFGSLDLKSGDLTIFPIRFPKDFNKNGNSYPKNFLPSFTAIDDSRMAYSFGIDDIIYILDTKSGVIEEFKVSNPNFRVNMPTLDLPSFTDPSFMANFNAKVQYYGNLFYDPYQNRLIRVGFKQDRGHSIRVFELLDNNMNIVAQFEQPEVYSGRPLFFPNEMWFPYLQGYKEDTMKLMRVRY